MTQERVPAPRCPCVVARMQASTRLLAAGPALALAAGKSGGPWGASVWREMQFSMRCLLLGHEDTMVRSPERLRLRCDHCRRETPVVGAHKARGLAPSVPVTTLSEPRGPSRLELSEHV